MIGNFCDKLSQLSHNSRFTIKVSVRVAIFMSVPLELIVKTNRFFLARATKGTSLYGSLCSYVRTYVRAFLFLRFYFICLNDQAYNCLIHFYKRGVSMSHHASCILPDPKKTTSKMKMTSKMRTTLKTKTTSQK